MNAFYYTLLMAILQELLQKLHTAKLTQRIFTGVVSLLIHYNSLEEKDWFLALAVSVEDNLRCKIFFRPNEKLLINIEQNPTKNSAFYQLDLYSSQGLSNCRLVWSVQDLFVSHSAIDLTVRLFLGQYSVRVLFDCFGLSAPWTAGSESCSGLEPGWKTV